MSDDKLYYQGAIDFESREHDTMTVHAPKDGSGETVNGWVYANREILSITNMPSASEITIRYTTDQDREISRIPGTFRNVIVTATAGENSSNAQLTIVPKAVAVRPNLLSARYSTENAPQRYVLEGGGVDAVLTWDKGANFKGELRDPTAAEYDELLIPKDKNCKVYVAPYKPEKPGSGQDRLLQLDQVQVTGAGRTENIDVITAWSGMAASLKVKLEAGGALKLTLAISGWEGEEELPPDQTVWFKVLGSGAIDPATGVYTPGATEGDYVVIAGATKVGLTWTYSVLPMPYTEADAQAFAEVNEAFNRLHAARS